MKAKSEHYFEYAEDRLPPGQPIIETRGVRSFRHYMETLMQLAREDDSTMAAVTGESGIGKTIAVQAFLKSRSRRPHTALPDCIYIKVQPGSDVKDFAEAIAESLRTEIKGRKGTVLLREAAKKIGENDVLLMLIDEADWLDSRSFDCLRFIYDCSGCPIACIGLPSILKVIKSKGKFDSRVGMRVPFLRVKRKEFLTVVLPQIKVPCWSYDPKMDAQMGALLWQLAGPSLRRLRSILKLASCMARTDGKPKITTEIINASLKATNSPKLDDDVDEKEEEDEDPRRGEHEKASEDRHDRKHG